MQPFRISGLSCAVAKTTVCQFITAMASGDSFYCRYYVGHKGRFGHEFMEFEFEDDGKLRYANNSNYKNDVMIRKEGNLFSNIMDVRMYLGCQVRFLIIPTTVQLG